MHSLSLCFWGSDPIALPVLDWFHRGAGSTVKVAAVVTRPDRRSGRGKRVQFNAIKQWALENGVAVRQPEKPGAAEVSWIREEGIALGLVMAYGKILPATLLAAPALGMWNLHGSFLPKLRGASPLETAIAMGCVETGISLMRMVPQMDAGPVAARERMAIGSGDTASTLRERAGRASVALLECHGEALLRGELEGVAQEEAEATYCRRLSREDGLLDFNLSAAALERRHRACEPWPGSAFHYGDTLLKVGSLRVGAPPGGDTSPGKIVVEGKVLKIGTASGILEIGHLQRPGGKMMPVEDFLRGFPLKSGTELRFPKSLPWVANQPFPMKGGAGGPLSRDS